MKEKALELMSSSIHCVISTLGANGSPQSAIVGFSEDDNMNLLIGTGKDSRKCKNISLNPKVSVVIADEDRKLEIQYEGEAKICEAEDISDRMEIHFKKLPTTRKRVADPNQTWVLITPIWIRYVDASQGPIEYGEVGLI